MCLLSLVGSVSGFDNDRSGMVMGAGAGLSPVIHLSEQVTWMNEHQTVAKEVNDRTKPGVNLHLLLGWGFDHANVLSLMNDLNAHTQTGRRRLTLFTGLVWHHYYVRDRRGFFSAVGLGLCRYLPENTPPGNAAGPGLLLGGGLLMSPHWQLGLYATLGSSSGVNGRFDTDRDHWSLSTSVTAVAF